MEKGNKRQEPMMRLLSWAMSGVCALVMILSGISWYQSNTVVDFSDSNTFTIHYMGHRMFYLQASGVIMAGERRVGVVLQGTEVIVTASARLEAT